MPKPNNRYRFRATVDLQISPRRYRLLSVHNIDLDKPFRYHLWIDWTSNNPFRPNCEIEFNGTVHFYRKRSGKIRFGIKDPTFIRRIS
jgi:hypothetical protein